MAKTDLQIPSLGDKFIDLRDSIPGDSYNWSWVRDLAQVNYLAVHHTGASDTQTPQDLANYHIQNNKWGGIGYHFVIAKDGTVYYVGDISTARANVANLNEQVIGICLVGNFTSNRVPTSEQLDSAHKLCNFFINEYPNLPTVTSWDKVRGHKELPNQSTACPGDDWPAWRIQIVEGVSSRPETFLHLNSDRKNKIAQIYRTVLGREADLGGLENYVKSRLSIEEILQSMVNSQEHQNLINMAKKASDLETQVGSLQTSLASVNQQLILLREALQEREQELNKLKAISSSPAENNSKPKIDQTLTIIQTLVNLYKFLLPPRKEF